MNAAGGERDFVHLVEVDGHPPSTVAEAEVADPRTTSHPRWQWWQAAAGSARVAAVLALAGAVAAVGTTAAAATAGHHEVHTTRTVTAPVLPGGSDALGCPVRSSCVVRASAAVAAVRADSFPDATGFDLIDIAHPGKPLARYLTAGQVANRLRIVSTCDPRRRPAAVDEPPRRGSTVSHRPEITAVSAGGDSAVVTDYYSRHDTFGCTVEVTCSYPVPAWSARLDSTVEQCSILVDRLGMDVRVYL